MRNSVSSSVNSRFNRGSHGSIASPICSHVSQDLQGSVFSLKCQDNFFRVSTDLSIFKVNFRLKFCLAQTFYDHNASSCCTDSWPFCFCVDQFGIKRSKSHLFGLKTERFYSSAGSVCRIYSRKTDR